MDSYQRALLTIILCSVYIAPLWAQDNSTSWDGIKILTYNIKMRPFSADMDERAKLLPRTLSGYDVIVFQEAFKENPVDLIISGLSREYPYKTSVTGRKRGLKEDSGVIIISKWPIEREYHEVFQTCAGDVPFIPSPFDSLPKGEASDCLAKKGVLYARININDGHFHLFGTHTDAGSGDRKTRENQFKQIRSLIDLMQIPVDEPVIVAGDLNVDLYSNKEYQKMLDLLSAIHPEPQSGKRGYSNDGLSNSYVEDNSQEYLDYVLFSSTHLHPTISYNDVIQNKAGNQDLSDHYPVVGEFSFTQVGFSPFGSFPFMSLYQDDNAAEEINCTVSLEKEKDIYIGGGGDYVGYSYNAKPDCQNDQARSAILFDIPPGRVIRFFDNPSKKREDDWTEVIVKRAISERIIHSFQESIDDEDVRIIYHRNNGLDGKISRIEVASAASGPTVDLYEGEKASQNLLCSISLENNKKTVFPSHPECDNDEARSAVLYDIPKGQVIRFYDHSKGRRSDDWVEIYAKEELVNDTLNSFEESFDNASMRQLYFRTNGLNGKVSRIVASSAPYSRPLISFFEGNDGKEDRVCNFAVDKSRRVRFKKTRGCKNDEARSVVLTNLKVGTKLSVYDHPECGTGDDWTSISIRQDIVQMTVNSFERSYSNNSVEVDYNNKNGLNGKVSCIIIDIP